MNFPGLKDYELEPEEKASFYGQFKLVMKTVNLKKVDEVNAAIKQYGGVCGVYFWLMRLDDCVYKIYAGKTKSLSKRLRDYMNEFQPHSPNDFKLRLFQEYIYKTNPEVEFDLYFLADKDHTKKEKETIGRYGPLINPRVTNEEIEKAKRELREAFSVYYSCIFKQKLSGIEKSD